MDVLKSYKGAPVRRLVSVPVYLIIFIALILIPTGFERTIYYNAEGAVASVIEEDSSTVFNTGLFRQGEQRLSVRILSGEHRGMTLDAVNMLNGSLESDKLFSPGDKAWVLVERNDSNEPVSVIAVERWRGTRELIAVIAFALILLCFAGRHSISIMFSFALAFLFSWKILVPFSLKGYEPMMLSIIALSCLTLLTIPLVSGFSRRSAGAIMGALGADLTVALMSVLSSRFLMLDGYTLAGSESLMYAGFQGIDMLSLFSGVVLLSSGGAVMDLAVDVAASMSEVYDHCPGIALRELFMSGIRVGRAGLGTQITTLLLAYMSSYLTVFMVYMAQGTPVMNILVSKTIASEISQTLVGCLGLVFVVPLTALFSAMMHRNRH